MISLYLIITVFIFKACAEPLSENECPQECICETGPLKNAPFVVTWLTSWGEESLPAINTNEIFSEDVKMISKTAEDAEVDINKIGLHATCSLHPTTNTTLLLSQIPRSAMVLTLMQAPGCNLTIVDSGQLLNMKSLIALHLQGYAHRSRRQVSGYSPNRGPEVIRHQRLMEKEFNETDDDTRDLRLALAEDALESLHSLELLDLQYVRLVASKEARRLRRYSSDPITSQTMVDLPLRDFLELTKKLESFPYPPDMSYLKFEDYIEQRHYNDQQQINNHLDIQNLHPILKMDQVSNMNNFDLISNLIQDESEDNILDDQSIILPYEYYKKSLEPTLAPFKSLHKLKYLRVAHARLDKIGSEFLEGLSKLHTLTLEHNRIHLIPHMMFHSSPFIRHLSLAHNRLVAIDNKSFDGLSQLLTLDLDFNNLTVLGPRSFPNLESLNTLRIEGNPLEQVLPGAFISINNTEHLFLGSSNVSLDIHEETFKALPFLSTLVLHNISIDVLENKLLTGMPHLTELTLHGRIPNIYYDAFSETTSISSLTLSHLMLRKISVDAFFGLHGLKLLDLSYNKISVLSPGVFDHLVNLRELYLNNNLFSTLPLGIFVSLPAKLIQLNENPWDCSCSLLQLKPAVTNKIKKQGSVFCKLNEKIQTICSRSTERLVYSTRVAPLCARPSEFQGNNVYHVALRHLRCDKNHWDPDYINEKSHKTSINMKKKSDLKIKKPSIEKIEQKNITKVRPNWIPLHAFTPKPIHQKDLLKIAEEDDLEEVVETTVSTKSVHKSGKPQKDEGRKSSSNQAIKILREKLMMERNRMKKIAKHKKSVNKARKKKHFEKMEAREKLYKKLHKEKQKRLHQKMWKQAVAKRFKKNYRRKNNMDYMKT